MRKIVLTGPESTGKTSLLILLKERYKNALICGEYARIFIDELDRDYVQNDLVMIAKGQINLEKTLGKEGKDFMICDTDLLTIKIWSEYKYGTCDKWILKHLEKSKPDFYFLCGIDVPWTYDPQREHPKERERLFAIYELELNKLNVPFMILEGGKEERFLKAISQIDMLLDTLPNEFFKP